MTDDTDNDNDSDNNMDNKDRQCLKGRACLSRRCGHPIIIYVSMKVISAKTLAVSGAPNRGGGLLPLNACQPGYPP